MSTRRPISRQAQKTGYLWLPLLIVLLLALAAVTAAIALDLVKRALVRMAGESSALAAAEVAEKLDRVLFERYGDVQMAARTLSHRTASEASDPAAYLQELKQAYSVYRWWGIADRSGRITAATSEASIGQNVRRSDWFQAVRDHRQVYMSDVEPFEASDGGMDVVAFAAPILDAEGAFDGVVTAIVTMQALEDLVTRTIHLFRIRQGFLGTVQYQFVNARGDAVVDSDLNYKGFVNLKRLGLPSALLSELGQPGFVEEEHLRDHTPVITAYAHTQGLHEFPGPDWAVLLRMEQSEFVGPARAIITRLTAWAVALALPWLALLLWMQKRLRQEWGDAQAEKSRAVTAEEALHRTCEELEVRIAARTLELATANSRLQDEIAERREAERALHRANDTLEERVKDRTQTLLIYQEQLRALAWELKRTEERERQRLATELHDNLAQMLAFCQLKLARVHKDQDLRSEQALGDVKAHLDEALTYTRQLMSDLRPTTLGDGGDLASAVQWVVAKVERHGLAVVVRDDGKPKPVDEEVLRITYQSLHELLFNVLKHAQTRHAEVRVRRRGESLCLVVRDRGAGFSPSLERRPSNTGGFGLFNTREQIDRLGGDLKIISVPGKGTLAQIAVPLRLGSPNGAPSRTTRQRPYDPAPSNRHARPQDQRRKISVLLVDDHRMLREGLRSIIDEQPDLEVVAEACDGRMAIELACEYYPNVVVMDVNMPTMNGVEATRRIRAIHPEATVIGLSVLQDQKMAELMTESGASAYLSKADAFQTLSTTIRSSVSRCGMPRCS